jgi:enediyne biosynthesis protein E4
MNSVPRDPFGARGPGRGWRGGLLLIAALCLSPATSGEQRSVKAGPRMQFTDIAVQAGLTAKTEAGGERAKRYIIETTGTGVAFVDLDGDGWSDIFLVNGSRLEGFPTGQEPTSHFYRNQRDGTFADVTQSAGVGLTGWGQGVCAGDYDNDGHTDLFVTFWGHNVLLRNRGGGTFVDASKPAGLWEDQRRWSTGCAFLDYDRDGLLDLFVSHYVDLDLSRTPEPGSSDWCQWKGIPVMCGPRGLKGTRNRLFHNDGNGAFTDVSERSGVAKTSEYYGFTVLTGDFDNDGWPDVYVACDSTPSLLFHNNRDGTFTELAAGAGVAYSDNGREQAGMGAHAGDYDGDGWQDIVKTNFSDDLPNLYRNSKDGTFVETTLAAGLGKHTRFLGWGTLFVDADNDGWPDVFMANGHVYPEVDAKGSSSSFRQRKLLYRNQHDGTFRDVSLDAGSGLAEPFNSHGVASADFDHDGSVELVVSNSHDRPSLLKNGGDRGNWLLITLTGTKSNRSAIGAQVRVRAGTRQQLQEVRSGGGYISQSDLQLHFGLGTARVVDSIEVTWPSGLIERVRSVPVNRAVHLREGSGIVTR